MSSDTYHLIRRQGRWYYLSMEFASADQPMPIDPRHSRAFATLEEAVRAADEEYTEYGLTIALDEPPVPDALPGLSNDEGTKA